MRTRAPLRCVQATAAAATARFRLWTEPAEERHANVASEVGARVIVMHPTSGSGDLPHELHGPRSFALLNPSDDTLAPVVDVQAFCARMRAAME